MTREHRRLFFPSSLGMCHSEPADRRHGDRAMEERDRGRGAWPGESGRLGSIPGRPEQAAISRLSARDRPEDRKTARELLADLG